MPAMTAWPSIFPPTASRLKLKLTGMDFTVALMAGLAGAVLAAVLVALLVTWLNRRSAPDPGAALTERIQQLEHACSQERARADGETQSRSAAEQEVARLEEAGNHLRARASELEESIDKSNTRLAEAQAELRALHSTNERLRAEAAKEREFSAKRIADLEQSREAMKKEFRVLAQDVMEQQGASFKQQNREQIEGLLNPLRTRIVEFQQGLELSQRQAAQARASLAKQIEMLGARSQAMSQETENLTRALKGQTHVQGAWGELVLTTILEKSGLREGDEFVSQETVADSEGKRLRPDVVVNLPNGHRIVVDAKVSLAAFERWVNAEGDEDTRTKSLRAHLESVRHHISELSGKSYAQAIGAAPDYVIMFVPIEGALAAALNADPQITSFALERNVTIASPTNLMTLLRTVANLWQVERRDRNAQAIAERAGKLYDKFAGFVADLENIGIRMSQAAKAHDQAMSKLTTGSGNLVRQVELLRDLGAKNQKSLSAELVDKAQAGVSTPPVPKPDPLIMADEKSAPPKSA
ncbi:MAG: DNA recombination protein RmuC [Gammaproteobacteria bacterium]|nr:DNA recombination protein RmuC [Gammaproteobacteria bacterium]